MSEQEKFFQLANRILERLERFIPDEAGCFDPDNHIAYQWQKGRFSSVLNPIDLDQRLTPDDLQCIDHQKRELIRNTEQLLNSYPANHALLWGPRGTGKSSLIRAILNQYHKDGLRLIEIRSDQISYLPEVIQLLKGSDYHYVIFCDDLSFEANNQNYKTLKVMLDGSVNVTPENIIIYATSNRRHLLPEYMSENKKSKIINNELHLNEAIEEKISLSERFGLWLSFHPFSQSEYLVIVKYWLNKMNCGTRMSAKVEQAALQWALGHGSRSGRSAWLFARDWTGKQMLKKKSL